ncbi:hypothetical protein MHU86_201 [Fragilaria crotonensis]|nr:hypothetical protein MHU86_201 [Fragilaria crotonensis]
MNTSLTAMSLTHNKNKTPRFVMKLADATTLLATGTASLPPMISVPCEGPITALIQPPNVDALYDWYVTVRQTPDADPSWAVVWPTAVSLALYIMTADTTETETTTPTGAPNSDNTDNMENIISNTGPLPSVPPASHQLLLANKRVVELGCGLGLCGLVAAKFCGAKSVLLSDREPFALHCALSTAAVNHLSNDMVQAAILDWTVLGNEDKTDASTTTTTTTPFSNLQADVVLASDVLYDGATIVAFARACRKICRHGGIILVTDPREERIEGARDMFRDALQQQGQDSNEKDNNSNNRTFLKSFDIIDLPAIECDPVDSRRSSMDCIDHVRRMREPTVLIKCVF